jgi:hypothetical protein
MSKASRSRRKREREKRRVGEAATAAPSRDDESSSKPPSETLASSRPPASSETPASSEPPESSESPDTSSSDAPRAIESGAEQPSNPHAEVHEDAFFARGEESTFPPSSVDMPESEPDESSHRRSRPEVIERRARMRRLVSWIVGAAAVLAAGVGLKAAVTPAHRHATNDLTMSVPHHVVASIAMSADEPAAPVPAAEGPAAPSALSATAETASATADPTPTTELAKTTVPANDNPTVAAPAPSAAPAAEAASAAPTKADVRRLIERGRMRDGIAAARASINADPSDAETYLLLGAALQELGQWKESTDVFGRCVAKATKGPKSECQALRGR